MAAAIAAVYQGQQVASGAAAALVFTPENAQIGGLSEVPVGVAVLLSSLWLVNTTNAAVTVTVWAGSASTDAYVLVPEITVPVASFYAPGFQCLTSPLVLMPGDTIFALAGAAASVSIRGDGQVVTQ